MRTLSLALLTWPQIKHDIELSTIIETLFDLTEQTT
jgi:hypothetical protein